MEEGGGVGLEGFALSAGLVLPAPAGRTVPLMGLNVGQKIQLIRVTFSRLQEYASPGAYQMGSWQAGVEN